MCLLALPGLLVWHAAVAVTAGGVGLGEPGRTLRALLRGHPLSGLAGAEPASTATTLACSPASSAGRSLRVAAGPPPPREGLRRQRRGPRRSGRPARPGQRRADPPGWTHPQRKRAPVTEIGLPLGTTTTGEPVVLPLEDHGVVVESTGAGKSRDVMIPAALDAPGGLVVTCTRADILDVIATRRAGLAGCGCSTRWTGSAGQSRWCGTRSPAAGTA